MANKLKYLCQFRLALAQEVSKETSHAGLLRIGIPAPKCAYISGKWSAIALLEAGSVQQNDGWQGSPRLIIKSRHRRRSHHSHIRQHHVRPLAWFLWTLALRPLDCSRASDVPHCDNSAFVPALHRPKRYTNFWS
jgi:hypothetical protein